METTAPLHVRSARWLIERNPTYLASAVCIVIGARLSLVSPATHAGDVGLILLTLGVLHLYESLVAALIVLLHARRRSPEDLPSLLLIMAAFWTGPMAATIEMTTHRAGLGLLIAVASSAIAVGQLVSISSQLRLPLRPATMAACTTFISFLAICPPLLKTPLSADGLNEARMYGAWLLLAALALIRTAVRQPMSSDTMPAGAIAPDARPCGLQSLWIDPAFYAITLAAPVAHLVGMNHAFFTHAKAFYAAPLICALAVVTARLMAVHGVRHITVRIAVALLPFCAIILSRSSFDAEVPLDRIPSILRNPFNTGLGLAVLSWWAIAWQLRSGICLHAANACIAILAIRLAPSLPPDIAAAASTPRAGQVHLSFVAITYGLAAYFAAVAIIRRSRAEGIIAIATAGIATICLVTHRIEPDMLATCWTLGWCAWLMILLACPTARAALLATPLVFLAGVDIAFGFNSAFSTLTLVHAVVMIGLLAALSAILRSRPLRTATIIVASLEVTGTAAQWLTTTDHAEAALAILGGFTLLALGGWVSWRKGKWLAALEQRSPDEPLSQL